MSDLRRHTEQYLPETVEACQHEIKRLRMALANANDRRSDAFIDGYFDMRELCAENEQLRDEVATLRAMLVGLP